MINQNVQSLSAFITNDLEKVFAILILILNILLIFWISLNYRSIIRFYVRVMDPTLLKMHTLIFILTALRIQAYSYAVGGCFLHLQGSDSFQPSVFRTLQSSSYIFYDLTLGIIGAKWIAILQKFFNYFQKLKALESILIVVLAIIWFVCQIYLVVGKIGDDSNTERTYKAPISQFFYSLFYTITASINHIRHRMLFISKSSQKHSLNQLQLYKTSKKLFRYKLDIALCLLVFGLLLRILFLQLKIWCKDWLVNFKYGFDEESNEDIYYWSIISFALFLLSDFIPTVILLQIFCPRRQNTTQSAIKESTLLEIE